MALSLGAVCSGIRAGADNVDPKPPREAKGGQGPGKNSLRCTFVSSLLLRPTACTRSTAVLLGAYHPGRLDLAWWVLSLHCF